MDTTINHANVQKSLATFEEGLNLAGYVPIVSMVSGGFVRVIFGKMEVIAGLALAAINYATAHFEDDESKKTRLYEEAQVCLLYAAHGVANIARGAVEAFTLVGNILTIVYDRVVKARFNYAHEELSPEVKPLIKTYIRPAVASVLNQN